MRTRMLHRVAAAAAATIGLMTAVHAASPPETLNYQGVLRDAADQPRDGSFDMTFTFFGGLGAADEILIDRHLEANGQAVAVTGGLFSVRLGGGEVVDGTGPGTYQALSEVFRDYQGVWLEVTVAGETLSPRIRINSAPYALNASHLAGRTAGEFLDTSGAAQTKAGKLVLDNSTGNFGIDAQGGTAGGSFSDADGSGYARVGVGDFGVRGFGNTAGAYFEDLDDGDTANLAGGGYGVEGHGTTAGGFFSTRFATGYGVESHGSTAGGYFASTQGSGWVEVGYGDYGLRGLGNFVGGYFKDADASGHAFVGRGERGIEGYGDFSGGYFENLVTGDNASVGTDGYGIHAFGGAAGGRFQDRDLSGNAYLGFGDYGIWSSGNAAGGYFGDANGSGEAYIGQAGVGINAYGNSSGGHFEDLTDGSTVDLANGGFGLRATGTVGGHFEGSTSEADVGSLGWGIEAFGNQGGGNFTDTFSGTFVKTASGNASTKGNGAKNFIQNHPYEQDKVILYAALEGDEVGTYTRGSAKLASGVARVALGPTFAWVTNPDIGLTAQLTARSAGARLYVESVTTSELVVRAEPGSDPEAAFDYVVQGLRIGFEQAPVVQPKEREAYIPSMAGARELFAAQPELERYTALTRFVTMRGASLPSLAAQPDFSAADALRAAIHEFDPEVDVVRKRPASLPEPGDALAEAGSVEAPLAPAEAAPGTGARIPAAAPGIRSTSVRTRDAEAEDRSLVWLPVSEPVEPGDVLALDPDRPGALLRAGSALDSGVAGIAVAGSRDASGGGLEAPLTEARYAAVKVDAAYGEIRPGDLLVASPTPGHAMVAGPEARDLVIGRALEPLATGAGTIRILVMLR